MSKRIYLSSPHMCGEEMKYIKEAFDTNWIAPLGANVDGFENEICNYTGSKCAVALSSGTSAIHLALKWFGVGVGDIVFCSSLTFSGTCNPITYCGAKPVFIDSDYETWNLSPKALAKAYEKYPHPKAVIFVNLYGQPADFDEIYKIAKAHSTPIIEDAAESLGAIYKGRKTGTLGDIGIFSFNGNKIITTSGGGIAVSNDEAAIKKIRFWSTQSRDKAPYYQHREIGYNYRMSNIVAGIGRGQLTVLHKRIAKKKYIFEYYKKAFVNIPQIEFLPVNDFAIPNYWLTVITLDKSCKVRPMNIINALEAENIEARMVWKPMHLQPVFFDYDFVRSNTCGGASVAEDIFNRGVCLPSDTKMTEQDLDRTVEIVKQLFAAA